MFSGRAPENNSNPPESVNSRRRPARIPAALALSPVHAAPRARLPASFAAEDAREDVAGLLMGSTCLSSRAPSRRRVGAQRAAVVYVALLRGDPRGFWHPKRTIGNRRVRPSTVDTPEHQRIVKLDAARPSLLCYHPTPIASLAPRDPTRTASYNSTARRCPARAHYYL